MPAVPEPAPDSPTDCDADEPVATASDGAARSSASASAEAELVAAHDEQDDSGGSAEKESRTAAARTDAADDGPRGAEPRTRHSSAGSVAGEPATSGAAAERVRHAAPGRARAPRWTRIVAFALVAVGVALRLRRFGADRSLWLDELMLALNLDGGPGAWSDGLDYHQASPFGFLWVSRQLAHAAPALGLSIEHALRLVPLVASVAALVLARRLAFALLQPLAALFALALFALGEPSVHYAAEFKPYGLDALFGVGLTAAAWRVARGGDGRPFVVVAMLAPWFSYPSGFVLAGCLAWLGIGRWRARRPGSPSTRPRDEPRSQPTPLLSHCDLGGLLLVGASGAAALLLVREGLGDPVLREYWSFAFAPAPPRSPGELAWYVREGLALVRDSIGLQLAGLGALFAWLGLGRPVGPANDADRRRDGGATTLLLLPIALALVASAARLYPFQGRLLLFAAPALCLLAGRGLARLVEALRPAVGLPAVAIASSLVFVHPLMDGALAALHPPPSQETRPLLERLAQEVRPGDTVWTYYGAVPAWRFYAPRVGLDPSSLDVREGAGWTNGDVWLQRTDDERWTRFERDLDRLAGRERVWILVSHIWRGAGVEDDRLLRHLLDARGSCTAEYTQHEARLWLYDLSEADAQARATSGAPPAAVALREAR